MTIMDYKGKGCSMGEVPASLPEELICVATHFGKHTKLEFMPEQDNCPLEISQADMCKAFKKVNKR